MLPTIATGNVASALGGGYEVANSCRFNRADGAYMHKTPGSAGNTGNKIYTFSTWVKRGGIATEQALLRTKDGSAVENVMRFNAGGELLLYATGGAANLVTSAKYRDPSAWYNIIYAVDTTQGVAANRVKLYVNGTQVTAFATETYPNADVDMKICDATLHIVGANWTDDRDGDGDYYLAETVLIDGTQYAASDFGEFSEDSPNIWMPKDVSGLTFGTNGFYLDYEASANLGNDANGGTDLTEVNLAATDQATDTPTNNFATFNPLKFSFEDSAVRDPTYSEGNLVALHHESGHKCPAFSTIAANSGKWYCEVKWLAVNGSYTVNQYTGIVNIDAAVIANWNVLGYFYRGDGTQFLVGSGSSFGATYTTNDIIGIFMDLDNSKLYFSKNGVMQNSGDPTSGSTGTGAISLAANTYYAFMTEDYNNGKTSLNCGNPTFAISSGNADADGYGNFEYDPQGYYALCTKNLAEYG